MHHASFGRVRIEVMSGNLMESGPYKAKHNKHNWSEDDKQQHN